MSEGFSINEIFVLRKCKSDSEKLKDLTMCLRFSSEKEFDNSSKRYDIYVNNKIANKQPFVFNSRWRSMFVKEQSYYIYSSFRHQLFEADTVRMVVTGKDNSLVIMDFTFVIDEKDSVSTVKYYPSIFLH